MQKKKQIQKRDIYKDETCIELEYMKRKYIQKTYGEKTHIKRK